MSPTMAPKAVVMAGPMARSAAGCVPGVTSGYTFGQMLRRSGATLALVKLAIALLAGLLFLGTAQAQRVYDQAELDAMLAPIALQPDGVVSQVADRRDLSRRSRRRRALVAREPAHARRPCAARGGKRAVGPGGQGAGRLPRAADPHGREPAVAARPRRSFRAAASAGHGHGAGAAPARAGRRQPREHRPDRGLRPGRRRSWCNRAPRSST